ncbi:hypothetical protein P3X46_029243 [Hevea brasiliensis]|uniref:BHLH domain-containing protein n=1 Tax=Hevea brasiliensis TaxID=3981 RepID=A0ABQ9KRJ8_HEVBR|nr:transcription factor bHLH110 [Hevea brasiliensis]KAJ9147038.1 hypothetical protein P3X46_029243 [Hevea brasiliensis]
MEPANLHSQHQLREQYGGTYSSLLFQPEYKVSSTKDMNPDIFLESWQPNRGSMYPAGLMSFCEAAAPRCFSQQSANELLQQYSYHRDHLGENHWLSNFCSAHHITQLHLSPGVDQLQSNNNPQNCTSTLERSSSSTPSRYNFSHILPSINISNSDLDLNLQAVELLIPKYDAASASSSQQASQNTTFGHFMGELFKESSPASSSNKASAFEDAIQRKKRSSSFVQAKKEHQPPSRSSCPQLKVRKEKLRERIATLQRLVAPYGKTDTASVLTEAIGYIQFLHDQVQTLSVPYMRSSNSKPTRTMQVNSSEEDGKGQPKRDLLNRGLCLVPLSCVSFFNIYGGGI